MSGNQAEQKQLRYLRLLTPHTRAHKFEHQTWHHLPNYRDMDPVNNRSSMYTPLQCAYSKTLCDTSRLGLNRFWRQIQSLDSFKIVPEFSYLTSLFLKSFLALKYGFASFHHILFRFLKLCSHLTFASALASNFKNGFYSSKWWCSHLTLQHDGKHQRKTHTQTLGVNTPLNSVWNRSILFISNIKNKNLVRKCCWMILNFK